MNTSAKYKLDINVNFDELNLLEGSYIVVLHATRVPPHIGMILGGYYHSLSIKGQEIKIPVATLVKTIHQKNIASLFIKIKAIETYNELYLMNRFIEKIKSFHRVDIDIATCLSPLKLFFEEEYSISMEKINYLYELLPKLEESNLILCSASLFIEKEKYQLPLYSMNTINEEIAQVRKEYK